MGITTQLRLLAADPLPWTRNFGTLVRRHAPLLERPHPPRFAQIDQKKAFHERETLTDIDKYNEFILLRLRTVSGIDLREMEQLFGKTRVDSLLQYFASEVPDEHFVRTPDRLHLTAKGLWFADGIAGDGFIL